MSRKNQPARRMSPRKELTPLQVSSVSSLEDLSKIARTGQIVEASISGLLLQVKREDLVPQLLRKNLNLDVLVELLALNLVAVDFLTVYDRDDRMIEFDL